MTAELLLVIATLCTPGSGLSPAGGMNYLEKSAKHCAKDLILCVENRRDGASRDGMPFHTDADRLTECLKTGL